MTSISFRFGRRVWRRAKFYTPIKGKIHATVERQPGGLWLCKANSDDGQDVQGEPSFSPNESENCKLCVRKVKRLMSTIESSRTKDPTDFFRGCVDQPL